jgi:hypothetical protein
MSHGIDRQKFVLEPWAAVFWYVEKTTAQGHFNIEENPSLLLKTV